MWQNFNKKSMGGQSTSQIDRRWVWRNLPNNFWNIDFHWLSYSNCLDVHCLGFVGFEVWYILSCRSDGFTFSTSSPICSSKSLGYCTSKVRLVFDVGTAFCSEHRPCSTFIVLKRWYQSWTSAWLAKSFEHCFFFFTWLNFWKNKHELPKCWFANGVKLHKISQTHARNGLSYLNWNLKKRCKAICHLKSRWRNSHLVVTLTAWGGSSKIYLLLTRTIG